MLRSSRAAQRRDLLPDSPVRGEIVAQARAVSVQLGGHRVLADLNLDLHAGEVVALVGPNGAGKSTLLAAMSGDLDIDRTIDIHGTPLRSWSEPELARRRAVLPQQVTISFPFRVSDVVAMGRAPWAGTPAENEDEEAVTQAMDEMDVAHLATRRFPSLSGGERARVTLARVLAQRTSILLLDEPTAALDVHHQELVMELIRARCEGGAAVLIVLHDLELAAAHADRLVMLQAGHKVADGPPEAVLTEKLLSDVYRHEIDVFRHPLTGLPMVSPRRSGRHQLIENRPSL